MLQYRFGQFHPISSPSPAWTDCWFVRMLHTLWPCACAMALLILGPRVGKLPFLFCSHGIVFAWSSISCSLHWQPLPPAPAARHPPLAAPPLAVPPPAHHILDPYPELAHLPEKDVNFISAKMVAGAWSAEVQSLSVCFCLSLSVSVCLC